MIQSGQHIKRIFNNTGYSYISFLFWNVGVLLCNIIAARFLAPEYFGKFFLISTFIMLMSALFTGDNATVKVLSENATNTSQISVIFKGVVFYQLIFALLAGMVLLVISTFKSTTSINEIVEFIGPVTIILMPYLFTIMFTAIWTGLQKLEWVMLNNIILATLQVIIFVSLLAIKIDFKMILWFWGLSWLCYLFFLCPVFFAAFVKQNNLKVGILEKWWRKFPHAYYLKYGLCLKITRVAQLTIPFMFGLFLKQLAETSDVGLYAVATRFAGIIPMLIGPLYTSLFPSFSQTFSEEGFSKLSSHSAILFKYVNLLIFLTAAFLILFNKAVIVLVFGENYSDAGIILAILSITAYFEGLRFISSMMLNATKHAGTVAVIEVLKCVFIVVLGYISIKAFGVLGGVGLILAVSVVTTLVQMLLLKTFLKIETVSILVSSLLVLAAFALTIISATKIAGVILLMISFIVLSKGIKVEEIKLLYSMSIGRIIGKVSQAAHI